MSDTRRWFLCVCVILVLVGFAWMVRGFLAGGSARASAAPATSPATRVASPRTPTSRPAVDLLSQRKEAEARAILDLVAADPDATEAWKKAINDPTLGDEARSNLIEDLNEDGFADPHHVTPDDLPLIVRRIQLIDELMPQAMDQTNAAALREARKDLVEMRRRLSGK